MKNAKPIIETDRLYFRLFEKNDAELLWKLDSDPEVRAHFPGGALQKDKITENLNRYINDWKKFGYSDFAIFEKVTNSFVGRAGFAQYHGEIEMGYVLLKEHWGKGFATEAAAGLINWAKQNIKASKIIALVPIKHIASQKVLEKIGMRNFKTDLYTGGHGIRMPGNRMQIL